MVEPIMYLAIGFLVAMLFALMIMPLVHNRAVRLTKRRLEAATPLSMAEIQADKDQLRAEFAMSARRLEISVDQLKNKTTHQLADIGKKTDAVNRMKIELGEKNETIFALEAREAVVKEQLAKTEADFAAKTEALRATEQVLAERQADLAKLTHELSDRTMLADRRQVELIAAHAHIDALKNQIADAAKEFATSQQQLAFQRTEFDTASAELAEARARVENLSHRVADLDRQLVTQVREAETLGGRAGALETELGAQTKALAEREFENGQLRQATEAAERVAQDLRVQVAALAGGSKSPVIDRLQSEKAAAEEALRAARDERAQLQRELGALQQQAGNAWATERTENALLRERINDIAAEVSKLAMTLEGPNSPIEAILAAEPKPARANGAAPVETGGTLADRIRALQSHASRAPQAG
jgi:chromosome segregation ATPase